MKHRDRFRSHSATRNEHETHHASSWIGAGRTSKVVEGALREYAEPIDSAVRGLLEPRFGHDFGDVRVHAGPLASESAQALGAGAYTIGSDIVFDGTHYDPQSSTGAHMIAHELAHVAQGDAGSFVERSSEDLSISEPGSSAEREADSAAASVLAGQSVTVSAAPSAAIHRIIPPPLLPTFPMPGLGGLPGYTAEWFASQLAGTGAAGAGVDAAALGTAATVPAGAAEAAALGTAATVPVEAAALGGGGALAAEGAGAAGAGAAGLGAGAIAPVAAAGAAGIGAGLGIQYGSRWLMNETGMSDRIDAMRGISRPAGQHGEYGVGDLLGYGMSAADNAISSLWADPSKPAYTQTLGWKLANLFD